MNLISSKIAKHVDVQYQSCLPKLRLGQQACSNYYIMM